MERAFCRSIRGSMGISILGVGVTNKNNQQDYFETAIQNLIDQGNNIKTIATNGRPWVEIDFPEDFEVAKKALLERKIILSSFK